MTAPLSESDRDILSFVADNPRRVFGDDPSFEQAIAFLQGLNAGRGFALLRWFDIWLVVRIGTGYEIHWSGLAECAAFQVDPPVSNTRGKSVVENRAAATRLFRLVDEFLTDVEDPHAIAQIAVEYAQLRARDGLH